MSNDLDDGWDDFDVDESDIVVPVEENVVVAEKPTIVSDGWNDDDDDLFFDDEEDDVPKEKNSVNTKKDVSVTNQVLGSTTFQDSPRQMPLSSVSSLPASQPVVNADEGWDDDDDLNFDDDEDNKNSDNKNVPQNEPTRIRGPLEQTASKTYHDLENYLQMLPHLNSSVNAVLETEYNTSQKACEVLQYFSERPGLVDYTIDKELPRMDYVVIEDNGMPLHEKDQIAAWMSEAGAQGSLLPRCANQSLLADLLQAMTGHDMLIRPQFLATAVATKCDFVLDAPQDSVLVKASLELTIPTEDGRWKVADLSVFCQLNVASPPSILYRLDVVKLAERTDAWKMQMASAARLIESMDLPEESFMNISYQQSEDGLHYRDAFLQQSQTLLQNSAVGFRSALKEIDAVAGISNKLSKLPGFLPDDVMEAADRAHEMPPTVSTSTEQRPTSILGGFLSSGLSRLAQTVNLPEEDPDYYQNWQRQQQQQQQQAPRGHRQIQHLYNRQEDRPAPKLYNRPEETPSPPRGQSLPSSGYRQEEFQHNALLRPHEKPKFDARNPPVPISANQAGATISHGSNAGQHRTKHTKADNKQAKESLENKTEDGWELEDDDIFTSEELAAMETEAPLENNMLGIKAAHTETKKEHSNGIEDDWVYDPETDIIPTRKRWVNPRPGIRSLDAMFVGQ